MMHLLILTLALGAEAAAQAPSLLLDAVQTTGVLSPERVAWRVSGEEDALLACFADPAAAGVAVVDLRWAVGDGGSVSPPRDVGSPPAPPALLACLGAVVQGIAWGDPGDSGATVSLRLRTEPPATDGPTLRLDPALIPPSATRSAVRSLKLVVKAESTTTGVDLSAARARILEREDTLISCAMLETEGSAETPPSIVLDIRFDEQGRRRDTTVVSASLANPNASACVQSILSDMVGHPGARIRYEMSVTEADPPPVAATTTKAAPILLGSLPKAEVETVIKQRLAAVRRCYQLALRTQPALAGTMAVKFTIGADGRVTAARVARTTLNHPEVETCIVDEFRTMIFPPPLGGGIIIVSYPFIFEPT